MNILLFYLISRYINVYFILGLMDGWFDACASYVPTVDKIHVFDFGMPYLKQLESHFYIKKGKTFDPYDLKGKKIGEYSYMFL